MKRNKEIITRVKEKFCYVLWPLKYDRTYVDVNDETRWSTQYKSTGACAKSRRRRG